MDLRYVAHNNLPHSSLPHSSNKTASPVSNPGPADEPNPERNLKSKNNPSKPRCDRTSSLTASC
ncbi:MAG: hypothetical protein MK194_15220 [Roseibacillus sp.]|nr:hypothetical protein [Roseibacillus sp.]